MGLDPEYELHKPVTWRWHPFIPGAMERQEDDGVWRMIIERFRTRVPPRPLFDHHEERMPNGSTDDQFST